MDLERRERRSSDGKALELLHQIREQNKVAQELRDMKSKYEERQDGKSHVFSRETQEQVESAITQMEQERVTLVNRLQRVQGELARKEVVC